MYENGTAKFKDAQAYLSWYANLTPEDAKALKTAVEKGHSTYTMDPVKDAARAMLDTYEGYYSPSHGPAYYKSWEGTREKQLADIREFLSIAEVYHIPLKVGEWKENLYAFLYMGNREKGIIVPEPEKYLEHIPEQDFSKMSPAMVRSSLLLSPSEGQMGLIPADANDLTVAEVADQKAVYEDALKKARDEMENIKNASNGELAQLQAQIKKMQDELETKKSAMMEELRERMAEMTAMKENLENQIYLLDSQIYAIRCFAGEVVKFGQIRSGKNAPIDSPIVVYQKLHFLDEDLGRMASIYEIQWENLKIFEDLLKHDPTAFETFTPNERCISLVRLSKDGSTIGKNTELPFQNMMDRYEYLHGKTVGILIRNGENLYLGWTDDKRVHIQDDLILTPGKVDYTPEPPKEFRTSFDEEMWYKEQKELRKQLLDGFISRSFVYNILQGVVEHTAILPLPSGVTLSRQSQYVVYSVADGWLTDNRFGSFTEIVERCNKRAMKGDIILTVQHLVAERERSWSGAYVSQTWNNVRGRGERNRTHDVEADDCTLYPINLVEYDKPVKMIRYRYPDKFASQDYYEHVTRAENRDNLSEECEIIEEYERIDRHVFISLKKEQWYKWDNTGESRANFELYSGEYINLTYMNSVWLEWVITNKTLGGWQIRGTSVNYAYAIRYLKTALDHIRKRETEEKAQISAVDASVCLDPDWPVALSEWKIQNNVREITAYQAKRFVKYMEKNAD